MNRHPGAFIAPAPLPPLAIPQRWGSEKSIVPLDPASSLLEWQDSPDRAGPVLLEVTSTVTGGFGLTAFLMLKVEHGSGDQAQSELVFGGYATPQKTNTHRVRMPLCATYVRVSAWLCNGSGQPFIQNPGGGAQYLGAKADVVLSLARGATGERRQTGLWIRPSPITNPLAAGAVALGMPGTLERIYGVASTLTNATSYFMLFDQVTTPQAGDVPIDALQIGAGNFYIEEPEAAFEFQTGIAWSVSSTPGTFTPDAGALVRVNTRVAR